MRSVYDWLVETGLGNVALLRAYRHCWLMI